MLRARKQIPRRAREDDFLVLWDDKLSFRPYHTLVLFKYFGSAVVRTHNRSAGGRLNSGIRAQKNMLTPSKDNLGKWCMLLLGSLMTVSAIPKLGGYLTTGSISYAHSRMIPFDLVGPAAALVYGLFFLVGVFLLVAGARGLMASGQSIGRAGLVQAPGPTADTSALRISADRDSVCAGDDGLPHEAAFFVAASSNVPEVLAAAWRACPLAGIAGGKATWLIDVAGPDRCIGVMAEQWRQPKLLIPPETSAADLFKGMAPSLYFRYWCQSDPDEVLEALQSKSPLPARYS